MKARLVLTSWVALALVALPLMSLARFDVNRPAPGRGQRSGARTAVACLPSTSTAELNINNVRALLHNGGDMWWDLVSNPRYEIPRVSNPADAKHSMFAASLWIGGYDGSGQLRIAAQTYRQSGNDFFPGPLRVDGTSSTDRDYCTKWDKHYRITRVEIDAFLATCATGTCDVDAYPAIKNWPGNNPDYPDFERVLAPFVDLDNDEVYEPEAGEYPAIVGDQAVWWVINDKGDIHTETTGEQIGVEIQMLAFAFSTSNEVNNMTFYRQRVINRSTNVLNDCYIGQWCDADLGFYADDFVGCDTVRGLGFAYNGDDYDEPPNGYGYNPPAIGIDFFQGPVADLRNDGTDSLVTDCDGNTTNRRLDMAKFIYYNNDFSVRGNPTVAQHFYGYLSGFWRNGSAIVDDRAGNGNGFADPGEQFTTTNYMFPDFPGQCNSVACTFASYQAAGQPWDEVCAGNQPFDRRFIQSAGPFTLQPGADNTIIVGSVWARDLNAAQATGHIGSVCRLLAADDVAQRLFDNCFDLIDGPAAPQLDIEEFDQELVLSWEYIDPRANNYYENYREADPVLVGQVPDPYFEFEGYMVYQLIDGTVSATEYNDPNRARVIAQCDVRNGISTIVNRTQTDVPGYGVVINDEVMVEGANEGLTNTLRVVEDAFATGSDRRIVNYRKYYFSIVAYATNDTTSDGKFFIPGNGNVRRYEAMPHKTEFENFGMNLGGTYGDGPVIRQTRGTGSGGVFTQISDETEAQILQNGQAQVQYKPGASPITVKVVNGKDVKPLNYRVQVVRDLLLEEREVEDEAGQVIDTMQVYADWILLSIDANGAILDTVYKSRYVYYTGDSTTVPEPLVGTERYIANHGISVSVTDVINPGQLQADGSRPDGNGVVGSTITFSDPSKPWLSGVPDVDQVDFLNWIRSGPGCEAGASCPGGDPCNNGVCPGDNDVAEFAFENSYRATNNYDPEREFQNLLGGTWAPYILSAHFNTQKDIVGPRLRIQENGLTETNFQVPITNFIQLNDLPNVDIVITSDPTKWSRCIVIETSPSRTLGSGASPMAPRWALNREMGNDCQLNTVSGTLDPNGDRLTQQYGYSYFPGYAIDVDRGVRLNIFFGESSWHQAENGNDMLFNPTSNFGETGKAMGGRHYIYVTNQAYDGCASFSGNRVMNLPVTPQNALTEASGYRYDVGGGNIVRMDDIFKHVAWVTIPMLADPLYEFDNYCNIPSDARISLRVSRQFTNDALTSEVPTYEFSMSALAADLNNEGTARQSVMEQINIVPNPFYGRSGIGRGSYEVAQLDNRVKITNLPKTCTIRIFTLNGQLVRVFRKDTDAPDQEWDLRNDYGVPVASGLYIVHVDAGGLGEKILKFFCIVPEIDLNAY